MAQEPGVAIMVMLAAIFVVPKIMSMMPDFDPLLAILGLFGVLAGLQHLGFVKANAEADSSGAGANRQRGDDDAPSRSSRAGASSSSGGSAGQKARDANPKDLLNDAERCMQQNQYARVQELVKKVLDLDPENGRAWELLATSQKWDGKHDEAIATVKKARDVYEVDTKALKALAKELQSSNDPAKVAAENEKKGEAFIAKRQYDLACECYTKAIEAVDGSDSATSSSTVNLFKRRAECAQQVHDWSLCRRDATKVLELEPNDTKALLQRAASNEALEKYKAALEDARKLLSLDPRSTVANRIVHNCQQALRHG